MKVKAFAKLNLSLNVFPRKGQFHPIDSLAISVDLCDIAEVSLRNDGKVQVHGCNNIPPEQNTAYRAAVAFQKQFGGSGCNISVQKHIPIGAGLGGSSADAAAVVWCLCKLCGADCNSLEVHNLCAELGSDVNFMLHGGLARMTGKGDSLQFFPLVHTLHFALATFNVQMLSKEVYCAFDTFGGDCANNDDLLESLKCGGPFQPKNGLQRAVQGLSDYAESFLNFCQKHNLTCCMTGSGSAYFVPATTQQEALQIAQLLKSGGFDATTCSSVPVGVQELR